MCIYIKEPIHIVRVNIYICQYIIPKYMTSWLIAKHLLVYKLGNSVLSMYIYIYIGNSVLS